MRSLSLTPVLALTALTLVTLPAQAQFVSIPVTNGNFTITNTGGIVSYTTLPTLLSPAGTLTITGANPNNSGYFSLIPITTNTPAGVIDLGTYSGSATLNDSRTATFTGGGASLRGTASVTGVANLGASGNGYNGPFSAILPVGATFAFTVQSGAVHIPASSLSSYPTPQFTIPVTGGSFTLTEAPGTGNATVTVNALLTPLGSTNITLSAPNLSYVSGGG